MHRSFLFTASLLSFASDVLAAGSAHVVNNCGFDVYYASVAQNVHANMQKLPSGGYSESYNKPNVGVSIKISTSIAGPVTQFEFTWGSPNIYYDISNINGNPFAQFGTSLTPSLAGASGYPTCRTLSCPAGQAVCDDAYNNPDDLRTMVCPDGSDLTFTLCPGGAAINTPPAQSVSSTAAISISAPGFSVTSRPTTAPISTSAFSVSFPAQPSATTVSTANSFRPTSFRTSTTKAAPGFGATTPAAQQPPVGNTQPTVVPIGSSAFPNPPVQVPTSAADNGATQTTAPTGGQSWSWGNWKHYHTHRAHVSGFRR